MSPERSAGYATSSSRTSAAPICSTAAQDSKVKVFRLPSAGNVSEAIVLEELELPLVASFCDWKARSWLSQLSSGVRLSLGGISCEGYWRFLCERLSEEHKIYIPSATVVPPKGVASTWQALFKDLFRLVKQDRDQHLEEAFKVGVAARFSPARFSSKAVEDDGIVLPLHQKVHLVKQQLGCSSQEALRMVIRQRQSQSGNDTTFGRQPIDGIFLPCRYVGEDKENIETFESNLAADEDNYDDTNESDSLAGKDEVLKGDARCSIVSVQETRNSILAITKQSGLREFAFDRVFNERCDQEDVYELAARRSVMDFLNGTSTSIICYGQTGSGKTHTMFGPSPSSSMELAGLVPRTCAEVLNAVESWQLKGLEVSLGASYVELFGSEVSDLLREGQVVGQGQEGRYSAVRATDRVGHRYVLDGNTEWQIKSLSELQEVLRVGDTAKRRAATAMNERSTRAHTVFVLSLKLRVPGQTGFPDDGVVRTSRFYFADLGGSEQLSKSKVDSDTKALVTVVGGEEQSRISWREFYEHRQRVQETLNINKGLLSLKRVIEALHRRSQLASEGVPGHMLPYVPYQDSKLTMLLQEALGGSARTLVIVTATMDTAFAEDSIQTLRFGETCAQVQKQRDADQAKTVQAALQKLDEDIRSLQEEIARKERWETRLVQRQDLDTVAGAFGEMHQTVVRDEDIRTTVLVGAEAEHEQLEILLQRQAELKGLGSIAQDFRQLKEMATASAGDGGRGVDFRHRQPFSGKTKAKDFEDEMVVADALRFFFQKVATTSNFTSIAGSDEIPEAYIEVAQALRVVWETNAAAGKESRSFGKAMLDRCVAWRAAGRGRRSEAFAELLAEVGVEVPYSSSS